MSGIRGYGYDKHGCNLIEVTYATKVKLPTSLDNLQSSFHFEERSLAWPELVEHAPSKALNS